VNLSFLKELDSSGFIDRLYKATPALSIDRKPKVTVTPPREPVEKKATARAPATTKTPVEGQEYTIQPGDTLSRLAGQFYGAVNKWPKIYEANTKTIKNPDYIYIGQKIVIPSS
jgi:nucleoid-associated protein YgaU